jgi:hypothetical protein
MFGQRRRFGLSEVTSGDNWAPLDNMFSPYREVKESCPEGRESLRQMIRSSMDRARSLYIHINNRLEGNAIETIRSITE